ncbi:hypothetical protein [Sphingomonas sp.]
MRNFALTLALPALALAACSEPTPQEQRASQIRAEADAQADALEAEAGNQAAAMEAEAASLANQAGTSQSYDSQRLNVRAEAMKREAELVRKQADARAKAVRDQGQAQASAILAQ